MHVHAEGPVVPGVDRHALDELRRVGLEVDGTVDAAEDPEVGVALGAVHGGIGRLLGHEHLELLARAEAQQARHVVAELVEGPLVPRAGGPTVDPGLGVGHRALEDEVHALPAPRARGREAEAIAALLVGARCGAAVLVGAEALELPVGGDGDRAPRAGLAAAADLEVPGNGVVLVGAREVLPLGRLGRAGGRNRTGQSGDQEPNGPSHRAPPGTGRIIAAARAGRLSRSADALQRLHLHDFSASRRWTPASGASRGNDECASS